MKDNELFTLVGIRPTPPVTAGRLRRRRPPIVSLGLLTVLILGCLLAGAITTKDPKYLDLAHCNCPPDGEFLFGTDPLGRDIFACIWYGGRSSLTIGFLSTAISTLIAVLYGTVSGVAPAWLDRLLMRLTELLLSVPSLLTVLFLQAILGTASVLSISIVLGVTGWCTMAKVIRTEVRQLRQNEYVIASRCMGGGFFHVLRRHFAPNFVASIMFMVVMNVRTAIAAESTLSFMGMGLPLETISWGSMLSLAEKAMLTGAWWMVLIPGAFLVMLLMCLTNVGNFLRAGSGRKASNL